MADLASTLPTSVAPITPEQLEQGSSLWSDAWARLRKNKLALGSLFVFFLICLFCIVGPWFSSYDSQAQDLFGGAEGPSAEHWFGTDTLGRDLMVRVMEGGRISLLVGLVATSVSLLIGVIYGATAGYVGGKVDAAMMRFVDLLYALPFTIFVILLMVTFGSNIVLIFVAIGAVEWLTMSRIVRGQTLTLKNKEFVEAALAAGLGRTAIIARHIVPNLLGPVVVYVTLTIPAVILAESFLSFLGLGVQPPMASLGTLVAGGASDMELAPWLLVFPSVVIVVTLMCFNFIGDGLRDAIDPKDR